MHISQFHKTNPRNLTGGDGYTVDCGLVSLRGAAIYGRTRPLIPYAEGRLIKAVRFLPPTPAADDIGSMSWFFMTPNTYDGGDLSNLDPPGPFSGGPGGGFGQISPSGGMTDTEGVAALATNTNTQGGNTSLEGDSGNPQNSSQICDCGPLIFAPGPADSGLLPIGTWQANHPYCVTDYIVDVNGNLQYVTTNGISGSTEPTWGLSGTTADGTITWTFESNPPTSEVAVHVIVEVVEGVSPMPPYPATLEFVSPPITTVSGETMDDVVVMVKDQFGDPYTFFTHSLILHTSGDGDDPQIIAIVDKTTGLATFSGIVLTTQGTYVLRCQMIMSVVADPIFSDPFDVTAP